MHLKDISSSDLSGKTGAAVERLEEYSLLGLQSDFISARDDYHELIQLCIKFLGKITFNFSRPEPLHVKLGGWQRCCILSRFPSLNQQLTSYQAIQ